MGSTASDMPLAALNVSMNGAFEAQNWTLLETTARNAIARFPQHIPPRLRLAQALEGQGNLVQAQQALDQAFADGLQAVPLLALHVTLSDQLGDTAAVLTTGRKLLEASKDTEQGHVLSNPQASALLTAANLARDKTMALTACARMLRRFPGHAAWLRRMAQTMAWALEPDQIPQAVDHMLFSGNGAPEMLRILIELVGVLGTAGFDALAPLDKARARWPDAARVQQVAEHLASLYDRPVPGEPAYDPNGLPLAEVVMRTVRSSMRTMDDGVDAFAAHITQQLSAVPRKRPLIGRSDVGNVEISPSAPRSAGTVVVINNGRLKIALWELYFAALGMTAIYLSDSSRMLGCNGIAEMGPDIDSTAQALRAMIPPDSPHLSIVACSGACMGAMNLAARIPTDRLLLLGPSTCGDRAFLDRIGDHRGLGLLHRISETAHAGALTPLDRLRTAPPTRTVTVFAEDNPIDSGHARVLADLPGLQEVILPGTATHLMLQETIRRDMLLSLLDPQRDPGRRPAPQPPLDHVRTPA